LKTFKRLCMKNIYLPLACIILFLYSCSPAYKTAQTPDDVYYSPGSRGSASNGNDQYYNANSDDQYLMMKSQDPSRWSYFDDYAYDGFYSPYYSPYGMNPYAFGLSPFGGYGYYPMGFYSGFGISPFFNFGYGYWGPNYLSNYYLWNGLYNPYYGGVVVVSKNPANNYYTQIHPFALTAYTGTAINNSNIYRSFSSNGVRSTPFSKNSYNHFSNNSFYRANNSRFGSNNSFFHSQTNQSFRSFSPSSFGGGGGSRSFGRVGR
jgi:hypothetical protein